MEQDKPILAKALLVGWGFNKQIAFFRISTHKPVLEITVMCKNYTMDVNIQLCQSHVQNCSNKVQNIEKILQEIDLLKCLILSQTKIILILKVSMMAE